MPVWSRCLPGLRGSPQRHWYRLQRVQRRHSFRGTSVPARENQHIVQHAATKLSAPLVKHHVDPYINPYSLRETLQEHYRANRDGNAINGAPIRATKLSRQREAGPANTNGENQACQKGYKRPDIRIATSKVAEYGGVSRPLTLEWRKNEDLPRGLRIPWGQLLLQNNSIQHNVPAKQRLLDEMKAMYDYLSPTSEEDAATQHILQETLRILDNISDMGAVRFEVIGSRATGIHGPLSDIDLTIHGVSGAQFDQASVLRHIFKFLRYPPSGTSRTRSITAHKVRKGRVPLIDCEHSSSGLQIQIQCTNDDYESIEITKAYLAEFRTLAPIYQIIKQMLVMRGLGNGKQGGISSYALFHMVVASFKLQPHNTDPVSQLLGFLDLYSEIDFYTTGIEYSRMISNSNTTLPDSVTRSGYDPLSLQPMLVPRQMEGPQYLMSLQDPSNLDNDLGRAGSLIKHVQATFIEARGQIRAGLHNWEQMYKQGHDLKTHGRSILACCLEGDYSKFEEQRRRIREYTVSRK